VKLYIIPGACSLAVNIALREAGLPFELIRVDGATHKTEGGADFLAINPKGYVPALQLDDGQVLTETAAVLQYVADLAPQARLAPPAGSLMRYRLMEWLSFINSEVHKGFLPLYSPEANDAVRDFARDRLVKRLEYLQGVVRAPHLLGGEFTVADAYLFTVLGWCPEVGLDLGRWQALASYHVRTTSRFHVAEAVQSEA
jgi:glutathione S-transferase